MRDLNRYVVRKYAFIWKDIGIELGLPIDMLNFINEDYPKDSVGCFLGVLDRWLKLTPNATWRSLEIALTNASRQQLGLDPVDDV